MQPSDARQKELLRLFNLLNTTPGTALVDELEDAWDTPTLLGEDPQTTAYNVGLRDAYRFVRDIQAGTYLEENVKTQETQL